MGVTLNIHLIMHSMMQEKEKLWITKYLKSCSICMMILGLLLCFGGGWIIQDDVTSRHQLRKVNYGLPAENVEFTIYNGNQQLFSKPHFTTAWRLHYEAEIH